MPTLRRALRFAGRQAGAAASRWRHRTCVAHVHALRPGAWLLKMLVQQGRAVCATARLFAPCASRPRVACALLRAILFVCMAAPLYIAALRSGVRRSAGAPGGAFAATLAAQRGARSVPAGLERGQLQGSAAADGGRAPDAQNGARLEHSECLPARAQSYRGRVLIITSFGVAARQSACTNFWECLHLEAAMALLRLLAHSCSGQCQHQGSPRAPPSVQPRECARAGPSAYTPFGGSARDPHGSRLRDAPHSNGGLPPGPPAVHAQPDALPGAGGEAGGGEGGGFRARAAGGLEGDGGWRARAGMPGERAAGPPAHAPRGIHAQLPPAAEAVWHLNGERLPAQMPHLRDPARQASSHRLCRAPVCRAGRGMGAWRPPRSACTPTP
jgi:hypothetical protein